MTNNAHTNHHFLGHPTQSITEFITRLTCWVLHSTGFWCWQCGSDWRSSISHMGSRSFILPCNSDLALPLIKPTGSQRDLLCSEWISHPPKRNSSNKSCNEIAVVSQTAFAENLVGRFLRRAFQSHSTIRALIGTHWSGHSRSNSAP